MEALGSLLRGAASVRWSQVSFHCPPMSRPIRIAGAGPSGLAAAIVLARAGVPVEIFERRAVCGARFGGDLQGLENWSPGPDALEEFRALGIATDFYAAPCTRGIQTDGDQDDVFTFPAPAFYLVKRGDVPGSVDRALCAQAQALGVTIHFSTPCPDGTADIEATGPRGRAPFAIDTGIVFETDAPDMAVALLNDDVAPGGYAYLLITNGYGCCCTMLFRDFPTIHDCFRRTRERLIDQRGITVRNPRTVGGLGHVQARGQWLDGAARRVGEAAGLQDFLWGFGIRMAVRSGVLAAQSILAGTVYPRAEDARFAPALRVGVINRWLWELAGGGRYRFIRTALRLLGPMRVLRLLHREQWFHRLLLPVSTPPLRRRYPAVFSSASRRPPNASAPDASTA